jgi:hypothetical protein
MIYCFFSLIFGPTHRVARGSVDRAVAEKGDVGLYPTSQANQSIDTQAVVRVAKRQKAATRNSSAAKSFAMRKKQKRGI